ncbi:GNAT family N-acetyltransferase [Denitromonas iodatirespirans]|uniref:GNAT family N-acetyltransferase n=1 Tax=Denitromonas iodatirespirans TaxID=2795389 RepID=A0A944H9U5_DENI1|nr:GNAT family N-acetyltransferase [Denitromonas iodatirespirans]MBT0962815.1 GNAT family N-acetyltransferase [Denitromonas iodatirespirans]
MEYRLIDETSTDEVARLAVCLTNEIIERTGVKHFDVDLPLAMALCDEFVRQGQYSVIAAFDGATIVGFGALCECRSLYAEGSFGTIQEFYVLPDYRSRNIGKALLGEIIAFAKRKGWKRLELCTPPVPEFDRTVAFYQANGFEITGGYKMKYAIG